MNTDFVSLHNHTTYSIMDSLIKPTELFKKVKELGQSAVAVTDHGTLAGAWDCLKYSKEAGVKLIMGCEFYFVDDVTKGEQERLRHVILIAKNHTGYKNLLQLSKLANDNHIVAFKKVYPRIDWKMMADHSEGLICTTACSGGILGQLICTRRIDVAREQAKKLKEIFGENLALEIQPHAMTRQANSYSDYVDQRFVNNQLIRFGKELDIKIVPTTNAHYLTKDQWEAHDVMLAIGAGQPIKSGARLKYTNDFYLKTREEVREFFARLYPAQIDEWLDNTLFFSNMCETPDWIDPKFSNPSGKELPEFPVKDQRDYISFLAWRENPGLSPEETRYVQECADDIAYLRYWCYKTFNEKVPADKHEEYSKRLHEEFEVIEYHGFSSYMLIVADYIDYCRLQNIPVGPGRGSVGGSLIGYLTGIHQADPIKYKLIFARFHNKEKTSFPDIDSDFAPSGREQVQEYIRQKYGVDRVAHVSNVNTMTPKVFARDIARVFQYGGDHKAAVAVGNQLADSIPGDVKSMDSVFEKAPLFSEMADKKYPELKKYANLLASKTKAWSTHAGGLVIGRRPLAEIVPLRRDKEGSVAIEYEKERAEANGLVKMDTLGLETLDIIRETNLLIAANGKKVPEPFDYEKYDEKTYDLISRGDTLCVFQFGTSAGTVDLCRRVKPRNLWDLALINALARPSAKDLRDDFIKIRNGEKELELLHPSMGPAFKQTFGLFEECLMFLAKDVADWDLHYADNLRKMTKEKGKNPKKVAGWRKEFIANAVAKNGIPEKVATKIWDDVIDKFQGYGFNMPHALLYSMISYHTAYLKAHFPLEFLTANLISEVKSNAKISADNILKIKDEIRHHKVKILPPDLNESEMTYKIIDDKTLLTGLDSLKFIGKDAIPEIMAKRPFKSFADFLTKVDGKKVRAPSVCALAASGCLDIYQMPRKQMFLYAADFKKKLQVWNKKERQGEFQYPFPEVGEWNASEKFAMEHFYLGEGLSGNIYEIYPGFFDNKACDFSKLSSFFPPGLKEQEYWVSANYGTLEGVVKSVFEFKVKKEGSKIFGKTMARIVVADPQGHTITLTIFPDRLEELKSKLKELLGPKIKLEPGIALHFAGYVNWYEGDISILFEGVKKCAPPPSTPNDLKARKVSMKISGTTRKKSKNIPDPEVLLDEIEEELDEEGLSEPEEEFGNDGELWQPGDPDGFC